MTHSRLILSSFALITLLAGCGRKQPTPTPTPTGPVASPPPPPPASAPVRDAPTEDPNATLTRNRAILSERIYFAYDQSDLSAEARAVLDRKVGILGQLGAVRLRIEGHADERGSDEYNLALGNRRAASVKRYLTSRGLDASRFEVMSFGEERPSIAGHDESAWAQNRRSEFQILSGM